MSLLDVLLRLLAAGLAFLPPTSPQPTPPLPAEPPRVERAMDEDATNAPAKDAPVTVPTEDLIER